MTESLLSHWLHQARKPFPRCLYRFLSPELALGFIPFDCLGFAISPIGAKYLSQGNALGIMQQYLLKPRRGGIKVSKIILIIFNPVFFQQSLILIQEIYLRMMNFLVHNITLYSLYL